MMKIIALRRLFLGLVVIAISASISNADVISTVDFESGPGVGYTTSIPEFNDGSFDYFTHSSSGFATSTSYNGAQGAAFFAAQDIDDGNSNDPQQSLFINGIGISNFENLTLDFALAEDQSSDGNEDWDSTDFFDVFATVDGNQTLVFSVRNANGGGTNGAPRVDTNFDGTGNGTEITDTFANFQTAIANGSTLDLEFRFRFNAGDEDLAIDNIVLQGDALAVPEPGSGLAMLSASIAFFSRRRRR